jgi:photosystem II stability/assembly factor-like uncharacterized protein
MKQFERFSEDFGKRLVDAGERRRKVMTRRARGAGGGIAIVALLAVGASLHTTSSSQKLASVTAGTPPQIEHETTAPDAPDEMLDLKQSSAQDVSVDQVKRAQAQAAAVPSASGLSPWQLEGPANVGGRVTDLVMDNQTPNTLFVASSGGGIWKSTDSGANFTTAWPNDLTQAMGALAQAPNGTLWAGTGEANPSGGGLTYFGDGIYKSSDGGASWQHMGLEDSASFGRIAVDPDDSNTVFAAASGSISRVVSQRGLYRTTDGGTTWKQVLAPPNDTTGAIDVTVDHSAAHPHRVYAALWDKHRNNGARVYGGVGSGLFRSDDDGDTWTRLQNIVDPLPSYDTAQTGLTADASLGRIGIAFAPSDPDRIYVVSGTPYGPDKGMYYSTDGGDSFHVGGRAYQTSSGYQWWFGRLWVDPKNEDHLFNADVALKVSSDGGKTWQTSSGPHSDHHAMVWDPNVPNRVYNGDDGGVYRSDSNGATNTWVHGISMPWNQSYHLGVSQTNVDRQVTGLQDNGSVRTWSPTAPAPTDLTQWNAYGGGDGHTVAIDPTDDSYYYECYQPTPPSQSCAQFHDVNGKATQTSFQNSPRTGTLVWPANQRWTTDTPFALDPNDPATVYVGGSTLGVSHDRGAHFTVISPTDDASSLPGPVPADENDLGPFYANEYATISAIAPTKTTGLIYVGTDTGRMWKTADGGANWTRLTGTPTRWVNAIQVDPSDSNHLYVAFSGYREGDDAANVYESHDGGSTWANISSNLPNGPVEEITYDGAHKVLYAATDYGLFDRKDGDGSWYLLSSGLPKTPIMDVKLSGDGKWLVAATFGRSVWKLPLSTSVSTGPGSGPGGTVPATLSLSLGTPAAFGAFTPGVEKDYGSSTTASVTSTAGDATLTVADTSASSTGHLVNGSFSLPSPLMAKATSSAGSGSAFGSLESPVTLLTYTGPVSNDAIAVAFQQHVGANDALRTGAYTKTLTFTLSTTTP